MKQIDLPSAVVIAKEQWTSANLIRRGVLTLPFWKESAELKTVEACLAVSKALDINEASPVVSDDVASLLGKAMATAVVADGDINQFFMQCFSAVLRAKEVTE